MDVIISPLLFVQYVNNKIKPVKSENDKNIDSIIENNLNKLVLCKKQLDYIESKILDGKLKEYFRLFIAEVINSRKVSPNVSLSTNDDDIYNSILDGYAELNESHKSDFCFCFKKKEEKSNSTNDCIFEEYKKPNMHWLGYNIAAYSPRATTVRYYDFSDDSEINSVIEFYVKRINKAPIISIFDRYLNLDHSVFSSFSNNYLVHYYTAQQSASQNNENIKNLRKKIKRLKMFVGARDIIHERRIIINNLLIEFDDDYWNISVNKNTWKIDITYCPTTVTNIQKKVNCFRNWILN
jgi:hypothetical protein